MILWVDGAHDAPENMRRDRALLSALERTRDPGSEATLRLFAFEPAGITLGHAQDPERELDLARCRRDHVLWAVRPTGGRAIFHAEEWTYALAASLDDPLWGGSLASAYARVSDLVAGALRRLGVPAVLARAGARAGSPAPRAVGGPAAPCFASTARHEIEIDGRKVVGSAQRRLARALLQEGSILLGDGHLRLVDYLALPDDRRARARDALARATCPAGAFLGSRRGLEDWAGAVAEGLPPGTRVARGDEGLAWLTA
jgi:lipoate-protein ligase A